MSIEVEIANHDYTITQSPGLLCSDREEGTTGAVLWRVTPYVASWLGSPTNVLKRLGVLGADSTVVELGCGISGLVGLSLSPHVRDYLLTDQRYVIKLLKDNVAANKPTDTMKRKSKKGITPRIGNLHILPLDWKVDSALNVKNVLSPDSSVRLLLACDCIYNDFLIKPFVQTCVDICSLHLAGGASTVLLVAQQLRSESVLESWLRETMKAFLVWRIPDNMLTVDLQADSGFVLHLAVLKGSKQFMGFAE